MALDLSFEYVWIQDFLYKFTFEYCNKLKKYVYEKENSLQVAEEWEDFHRVYMEVESA